MSLPLSGKVALVTGSSRGIGAATARRLAADGASVVINYFGSAGAADALVREINAAGHGAAIAIRADMGSIAEGVRLVEETLAHFGRLDVLVLNAGILGDALLANIDEGHFDEQVMVHVKVPLFMVKAAAPHLKTGGRVIFVSSTATKTSGIPANYAVYSAAKGAVEQITRVLAKDLGAKGITVNAVAPGFVDTDMVRKTTSEEGLKFLAGLHPQNRLPGAEEIAPIFAFLARDEAGWVNGQTIFINGGAAV
ncbi:NAD(P)-dependent dehydrogenase [Phanerochaete sordida]|uniref:NAD(P)-dependent dehydrogenase n=1 Tax=Phanerochaete sordida TaxID=48140 RepID=A0A9P3GCN1_9APHY|nr:NAD(P)-dependent dehydrogenase [Phanerochaete sordida]